MLGTTETLDNPDTIDKESLNGKPCQDEFLVEDFLVVDIAWPKRRSLAKFAEATDTAIQLKSKYTQILFLFSTPCVDAKTGSPSFSLYALTLKSLEFQTPFGCSASFSRISMLLGFGGWQVSPWRLMDHGILLGLCLKDFWSLWCRNAGHLMTGFWNSTKISCLSSQRNSNVFMQHVSDSHFNRRVGLAGGLSSEAALAAAIQLEGWESWWACGCHNSRAFSNIVMLDFRKWACGGMWGSLSGVVAPGAADWLGKLEDGFWQSTDSFAQWTESSAASACRKWEQNWIAHTCLAINCALSFNCKQPQSLRRAYGCGDSRMSSRVSVVSLAVKSLTERSPQWRWAQRNTLSEQCKCHMDLIAHQKMPTPHKLCKQLTRRCDQEQDRIMWNCHGPFAVENEHTAALVTKNTSHWKNQNQTFVIRLLLGVVGPFNKCS